MTNTLTVNGNTYTDDSSATTGLGNGGHRTRLLPMLSDALVDLGKALTTTVSSALALPTGSLPQTVSFTLDSNLPYQVGSYVLLTDVSQAGRQMLVQVTAKSGTAVTGSAVWTQGSAATPAQWRAALSGPPAVSVDDPLITSLIFG
jgi:hypothetical protein